MAYVQLEGLCASKEEVQVVVEIMVETAGSRRNVQVREPHTAWYPMRHGPEMEGWVRGE